MKQINKIHHTIPIRRLGIMLGLLFTLGIFNFSQAQVGTPAYMNHPGTGATANAFPLNSATSNKVQWIYAPGAFTTLGSGGGAPLPGGQLLTKIYIKFASANATSSYNDLTVSLGQNVGSIPNYPQAPATTGVPFNTGLTTCFYQASGFVFTGNVAGAWYGITLQTPFLYDPSLALICEVKCSNTVANGNGVGHITTAGISQRLYAGFAATTGTANTLLAPIGFDVISAAPCTAPPTAGTAISSSSNVCSGTNVSLGLVGNSNGSGQTYQWESSTTSGGPFSPIGASSAAPSLSINPTTTQYYRCQVTCSSVTTTSTEVLVNVPPLFPGGFYTIDNTLSTGGGNFASFNEAISAIACGISGPVTFDVASGTGPYTEQVVIPQIFGASSTNTITFLGNNQVLTYNATLSTAPSTLNLNGADFIRFNDLQIVGTGPTYALVTHLWNNANDNIFTNCTFTAPANGTATTQAPFSISGTEVSATATGQSGSNNVLDNCSMNNGYYGITMVGNSTTPNTGNQIVNCSIRDFYFYGSYNQYNNGTIISNNLIERPTRTTFTTSCYGIYLTTACSNFLVEKNKIRNTWVSNPSSTGTQYSIACVVSATLGNENKIYNNLVSDIQFSGTVYGLYFTTTNYLKAYHNTISLDHTTATGTTTTYGIYSSSTSAVGIDFQNNNISITRGGGGIKYGIQISSATGVTCNYNNIYVNASLGTNYTGYYLTGYTGLLAWQGANGGVWDQQSASFDPLFTDPLTYDYSPGSASINNMCNNLGVLTDINGISRGVSTDPGCYEFSVAATDMGVSAFVSPNTSGCYSTTEDIIVTIKNYGSAAIDFSTTSASVVCDITGAITSTLTVNPTGILLPGATMNITLTPSINMTVNGAYVFNPYTVLSGDLNNSNDALSSPITRTVGPIGGTVTSSLPQICVSGTPTLTVSGYSGGAIQWQESTVSSTGPWVNVGTGTAIYTPSGAITQTTYYQVEIACNGNLGYSNVFTNVVNNPTVISTIPGSRCGIGTVNLEATVDVGANAKWYTTPTGGVPLYTGSPFTTPTIAATTTYYVESVVGIGGLDSLGQPISTSGTTPNYHNMFKISSPTGLTLNSIGIKCNNTLGTLTAWDIYYRPNDYLLTPGSNTSAAGWTLLSSVTGVPSAGTTEFTYVMFGQNLAIPPGAVYSFYLAPITGSTHQYGTVAQNGTVISNTNATIISGNRGASLFNCPTAGGHPIIKIKYSLGCVGGTRVPVVATVNPAPSILASAADPILCPGGTTTVSVTSTNDPDYTYTWTSSIGGFTATGPGPHSISPLATTTYTVTAVDNTAGPNAGCAEIGTVTVVTAPTVLAGTVTSSVGTICVSGSPELTVTGSAGGAIQWQESVVSASGPFTNVGTGSSTYLPGIITQTTYYRVEVSCGSTAVQSNVITVTVNNPQILGTTPGSRCGYGSAALSATADINSTIKWYDAASGGSLLFTGANFNTPPISTTTTFFAEASSGGGGTGASPIQVTEIDLGGNDRLEIQNVSPDPIDVTGWKVAVSNSYTAITSVNTNVQVLNGILAPGATIAWTDAAAGPNYWGSNILWNPGAGPSFTGWAAILDNNNDLKDIVFMNWPSATIASASIVIGATTITVGSLWSGDGINTTTVAATDGVSRQGNLDNNVPTDFAIIPLSINATNPGLNFPFLGFSCAGVPRAAVIATVTPPPSISVASTSSTICQGTSTTLSVSSPNDPDYTYTWNPGGLTGSSITVSPLTNTVYTVVAEDNTAGPNAGCGNAATIAITVTPIQVTAMPTTTPSSVCVGGNITLNANANGIGYTMNTACTTSFIDISATGTDIDLPANITDDSEHNIAIPSFTFDGVTYTTARVGTNGALALGSTTLDIAAGNGPIPSITHTAGNVILSPYSDDLYPTIGTNVSIKTQTIGNTFIVQWTNLSHFDDSLAGTITFQTQMDLVTGTITHVYNDIIFGNALVDAGLSATVGIQMSATNGIQYSYNTASLSTGQCISFAKNIATVSWSGPNGFNSALPNPVLSSVTSLESGIYTVTATGSNGCATSSTVNLVVNTPTSSSTSQSIPCGGSYVWNGNTYTASGIYTFTTTGSSGCDSIASLDLTVLPCNTTLNLTAFIEGYWDGTSAMLPVLLNQGQPNTATECDNITVELISPATVAGGAPYTPDYTTTAMLNTNGTASAVFTSAVSGNYYIVIKHRNALQTWSANAMSFPSTTSYDFSSAASQAYGSNQAEIATGVWALFSGDLVVDENMDLLDLGLVEADISAFSFGYLPTDINGDGNVDLLDSPVLETNISNFVFSAHP